jgi:hypothetical protein
VYRYSHLRELIVGIILVFVTATGANGGQAAWNTFQGSDGAFRFLYPPDWTRETPKTPNGLAIVVSPTGSPKPSCNLTGMVAPETKHMTQRQVDARLEPPLSDEEWRDLARGFVAGLDLSLAAVVKIGRNTDSGGLMQYAIIEYNSASGKTLRGKTLFTLTSSPGWAWSFVCGAHGSDPDTVKQDFNRWAPTFFQIQGSLRLTR